MTPFHHCKVQIQSQDQVQTAPPADFTTSPAVAGAEDTKPGPTEAPSTDKNTVPSAKPNTETKEDLPTAWAASPAELVNQATPTAGLVDESQASLPHLAIQ